MNCRHFTAGIHTTEQHFEFSHVCTGKPYVCNVFHPHTMRQAWSHAHMYVMTFTQFAQNNNIGSLLCMALICTLCSLPVLHMESLLVENYTVKRGVRSTLNCLHTYGMRTIQYGEHTKPLGHLWCANYLVWCAHYYEDDAIAQQHSPRDIAACVRNVLDPAQYCTLYFAAFSRAPSTQRLKLELELRQSLQARSYIVPHPYINLCFVR